MSDQGGVSPVETELDRDIGIIGAVAIGVGTMIAAGIFVLSGLAVSKVRAAAIVSFLLTAIIAAFTATADHDLTIIGATREGLLQRILFGAIPEAVGRRAGNTVVMTKRRVDVSSRLRDLFKWR